MSVKISLNCIVVYWRGRWEDLNLEVNAIDAIVHNGVCAFFQVFILLARILPSKFETCEINDIFSFLSPGATIPIGGCILQPSSGLYPPRLRGFMITHNDAPQSVGLLWTNDQSVAETSTWQHTNIQALGGIRTHDRSRRAAVDLRLRPRIHWDRRN